MQPCAQGLHGIMRAMGDDFDGTVRQITGNSVNRQSFGLESRTVAKINSLDLALDEKTAGDAVHWGVNAVVTRNGPIPDQRFPRQRHPALRRPA